MQRLLIFTTLTLASCSHSLALDRPQLAKQRSVAVAKESRHAATLVLRREWDEKKTSNTYFVRYQVVNRGPHPVYPTRDNFNGMIERWEGGQWTFVAGGVQCVSGMQWLPMAPESAKAIGVLSVHPMILPRGRYRYRVEYSLVPLGAQEGATLSVVDEFEINPQ